MTITLGTSTLCDGADRSQDKNAGPAGLSISGAIAGQTAEYLRATSAKRLERGNRSHEVAFTVHRLCANVAAANQFALTHAATVARSGTLTFVDETTIATLSDCILDQVQADAIGRTVRIAYRLSGGVMTAS